MYHRRECRFKGQALTPILRDHHRLPPKELTDAEVQLILDDEPPPIEVAIVDFLAEHAEEQRRTTVRGRIQGGMQQAKTHGKHIGRPAGSVEEVQAFLEKPSSRRVITALEDGLSIRNAAAAAGVAPNTTFTITRLLDDQGNGSDTFFIEAKHSNAHSANIAHEREPNSATSCWHD